MTNQSKDREFITAQSSSNPLVIEQTEDGYRYSIEPFLLADFVRPSNGCRLLDVGTGCGVIPLLVATRGVVEEIVAIEIQSSLYDLAVKNITRNEVSDRIRLIHGDFVNFKKDKIPIPTFYKSRVSWGLLLIRIFGHCLF